MNHKKFLETVEAGTLLFISDGDVQVVARPGFSKGEWRLTWHRYRGSAFSGERYYNATNFLSRVRALAPLNQWREVEEGTFSRKYVLGIPAD